MAEMFLALRTVYYQAMESQSLDIKGLVEVIFASQLEQYTADGWVVKSSFTEDTVVPVFGDIANPNYRVDEYGNNNGQLPTLSVQTGSVVQKVTKFIVTMDSEKLEGRLAQENRNLKADVKSLAEQRKHAEEALGRLAQEKERQEGSLKEDLGRALRDLEKAQDERDLARKQVEACRRQIQIYRDFVVMLWSEVGNERMRQITGSRYPAELDDQTIPAQMAKTLFDHLLEDEDHHHT